jgi:ABC-type transporter Mla MlaB component
MLRITTEENGRLTRFRLEGKLKGDWVRELERCWSTARNGHTEIQFFVELSNVDSVDEVGRALLSRMATRSAARGTQQFAERITRR